MHAHENFELYIPSFTTEMDKFFAFAAVVLLLDVTFHSCLVFSLQQAGQEDARSTMEVVGMKREMDMRSLLVWLAFLHF